MLHYAFRNCNSGAMIRLRSNGGLFNLQRLKARTKVSLLLLRKLLFADDCALIAHNEDELQSIPNDFARVASRYGFTISITRTEVMPQPKLGSSARDPVIKVGGKQLKVVKKFCHLDGFLSQNACTDDEITSRISKGSASFGRLQHRLWSDHDISLSTKIGVYKTAVLTMLFLDLVPQSCEKNLTTSILNTTVLQLCETEGIEALLINGQLRRAGYLTCIEENRIPKVLFYGELVCVQRPRGGQHRK